MIPRLEPVRPVADDYLAFIDALPAAGWRGEVGLDEARRIAGAEAPSAWLEFIAQIEHANRAAMAQPMAAQRVGHCRDALSQLAHLGERWPKWWDQMAGGLADELRAASGLRPG